MDDVSYVNSLIFDILYFLYLFMSFLIDVENVLYDHKVIHLRRIKQNGKNYIDLLSSLFSTAVCRQINSNIIHIPVEGWDKLGKPKVTYEPQSCI